MLSSRDPQDTNLSSSGVSSLRYCGDWRTGFPHEATVARIPCSVPNRMMHHNTGRKYGSQLENVPTTKSKLIDSKEINGNRQSDTKRNGTAWRNESKELVCFWTHCFTAWRLSQLSASTFTFGFWAIFFLSSTSDSVSWKRETMLYAKLKFSVSQSTQGNIS